uniref:Transposase n=1 Tax=Strongyloides papillosus TaxID=174720 RepID=A0A0N5B4I4_STREA
MINRKIPSAFREIKGFLASSGFFRNAVKNFTVRVDILLDCVKTFEKRKIDLNKQQIDSFNDIINVLTSSETILLPDFTEKFT